MKFFLCIVINKCIMIACLKLYSLLENISFNFFFNTFILADTFRIYDVYDHCITVSSKINHIKEINIRKNMTPYLKSKKIHCKCRCRFGVPLYEYNYYIDRYWQWNFRYLSLFSFICF